MKKKSEKQSKREKFTTVSIPRPLFKKIEDQIKGTGFTSVSSYVIYVLREIVAEEGEEVEEPFSKEDKERVKARLRALGYIN